MPDIKDLNEIKEKAGEALDQVSKNKEANDIYDKGYSHSSRSFGIRGGEIEELCRGYIAGSK